MQAVSLTLGRTWRLYEGSLKKRPYVTQMTTSAVLWGLGDVIAQKVVEKRSVLNVKRVVQTAGFGCAFMGPVGHNWYQLLDYVCGRLCRPGGKTFLVAKVLADSFIFGPLYVMAFYAYGCAVMDGSGVEGFKKKMEIDFMPTFIAECAFWPLLQTINFTQIPYRHQLLAVNLAAVPDAMFLSWARGQDDWFGKVTSGQDNWFGKLTAALQPDPALAVAAGKRGNAL